MTKTATLIRTLTEWEGDTRLYRVDPPMAGSEYVIVSAVDVGFGEGPETYIFPAKESGEESDFLALDGSFRGELDHAKALKNAGYEVRS